MMLGREVCQVLDILLGTVSVNQDTKMPAEYVQSLNDALQEVHRVARESVHNPTSAETSL